MNSAAAHYYTQYYTGPSEQWAVVVWLNGGHPTETEQRRGVLSLVATLTGNPPETAITLGLCCVFCNSMDYSALCDVSIDQVMYKILSLTKQAASMSRSKLQRMLIVWCYVLERIYLFQTDTH
jgi:hypothetical protein